MNLNLKLEYNPKAIMAFANKYLGVAVMLIIAGLFGFTGYQISRITGIQADQKYLELQKDTVKTTTLKVNKDTLDQLKNLKSGGDTSIPVNTGKQNPFSLN
jgi:predicted negative regulator of RcsB-dependent stress response